MSLTKRIVTGTTTYKDATQLKLYMFLSALVGFVLGRLTT